MHYHMLAHSIQSEFIDVGITFHVLSAGDPTRPWVMLLHGFPELAYSWRKVMPLLKDYFCFAPDLRGYGRTSGGTDEKLYEPDRVVDELRRMVHALQQKRHVSGNIFVVGHDMGSAIAAQYALSGVDGLIMMSAPFTGSTKSDPAKSAALSALTNRKHYQLYFVTQQASEDFASIPDLDRFYRGYYYYKSALHPSNRGDGLPHQIEWNQIEEMPYYYIMKSDASMTTTVFDNTPSMEVMEKEMTWMDRDELQHYTSAFARTGFQGGLNQYKVRMRSMSFDKIQAPALYIAGRHDWGVYQSPGSLSQMADACSDFRGITLIDDAGHWVQQEQPERVAHEINQFIRRIQAEREQTRVVHH